MRQELWEVRAQEIRLCAAEGLDMHEAAARTRLTVQTVRKYAKKFGIVFQERPAADDVINAMRSLAAEGKTVREAAASLGASSRRVGELGRQNGIKFRHGSAGVRDANRASVMAAMFKGGKTLEQVGQAFGVTRERVRQIIKKHEGLTASDGGQQKLARHAKEKRWRKRDADYTRRFGCTFHQVKELRLIGREMMKAGQGFNQTPIGAYHSQKQNAKKRGIEFKILLWDWWTIWQQSGHWHERGRNRGQYVMGRFRDEGPYEIGNVYICTNSHNCSFQPNNPYRSSHPDFPNAMARKARVKRSHKGCSVDGCGNKHYGKGYCGKHYATLVNYPKIKERREKEGRDAA